jgi:hypothetical protein
MGTVNPAANLNAATMGQCRICGAMRQTTQVTFEHNIGMLVARQTRTLQCSMCKTCLGKKYWEFQGKGLLLGPWGVISMIVTPIYLITNTVSYVSASRKLQGAPE